MSKTDKLLQKIRNNPQSVSFEDLDKVLRSFGFEPRQPKGGSSHYFYQRSGFGQITVPRKKPFVKKIYVKNALSLIDEVIESDGLE
jgi:predicted RNA binding protein YcfA (HicA-like mRNA interferase family)